MARTKYISRRSLMTLKVEYAKRCKPLCDFCQSRFSLKSLRFSTIKDLNGEIKCYHLKCLFRTSIFPRTTSEIKNFHKISDTERLEIENLITKTMSDLPNIQIPSINCVVQPFQQLTSTVQLSQPLKQSQPLQQFPNTISHPASFSLQNIVQNNSQFMGATTKSSKCPFNQPQLPLSNQSFGQYKPFGFGFKGNVKKCPSKCCPKTKPAPKSLKSHTICKQFNPKTKTPKQPKLPKQTKQTKIPKLSKPKRIPKVFGFNTVSNITPSFPSLTSPIRPTPTLPTLTSTSGPSVPINTFGFGVPINSTNDINLNKNKINTLGNTSFPTNQSTPSVSGSKFNFGTKRSFGMCGWTSCVDNNNNNNSGFGSNTNSGFGSNNNTSSGFGSNNNSNTGFGSNGFSQFGSGFKLNIGGNNSNSNNTNILGSSNNFDNWPKFQKPQTNLFGFNLGTNNNSSNPSLFQYQSQQQNLFNSHFIQLYSVCDQLSKLKSDNNNKKIDNYSIQEDKLKIYQQMPIDYNEIIRVNYKDDYEFSPCIIQTIIDAMIYGIAIGCPLCGGKLIYHEGEYGCIGDHNGFMSCIFTTVLPKRTKIILDGNNKILCDMLDMPLKYRIRRDEIPIHRLDINKKSIIFSEDVLPEQIRLIEGCGYIVSESVNDADICISSSLNPYDRIQQIMIRRHKPIVNYDYFNNKDKDIIDYCMMYIKESKTHKDESSTKSIEISGISLPIIDPDSGYHVDDITNLYINNGKEYSVKLGLKNSSVPNYIIMQIIQHDNNYILYVKYFDHIKTNRTIIEKFNNIGDAQFRFEQLYCDLTLVKYDEIDKQQYYTLYQPIQFDNKTTSMKNITPLLLHIYDRNVLKSAIDELSPILQIKPSDDRLSFFSRSSDFILNQISQLKLNFTSFNTGLQRNENEKLKARRYLRILDILRDAKALDTLIDKDDNLKNLEIIYNKMNCDINLINKLDSRYLKIGNYIEKTGGDNIYFSAKISNLYSVVRHLDTLRNKPPSNHKLLWCGLYDCSIARHLTNGFKIVRNNIPDEYYPNGRSIKLYDMFCRALGYCQDLKEKCYLLLCDVYLGNILEVSNPDEIYRLPIGYDSAKIQGKVSPNYSQTYDIDGLSIPGVLSSKNNFEGQNCSCMYDEYLIYDMTNITIRYLVEVELK